ncbi:MAG: sensor histidine kinase [Crocinitomicaceae bacterium]
MKIKSSSIFLKIFFLSCLLFSFGFKTFSQEEVKSNEQRVLELIEYGRKQLELGNKVVAFDALVNAQNYSLILNNEVLFFKATLELANFYIMKNRMIDAREMFSLIHPSNKHSNQDNCRYFHRKAFFYNQLGTLDSAKFCSFKALEIAKENELKMDFGTIYNELGNIYEKYRFYDTSVYYYNLAVTQFDTNSFDYANAAYNKGRTYFQMLAWDSSVYYLERLKKRIADTEWSSVKAPTYNYLAENYFLLGDSSLAFKYKWYYLREELRIMQQVHGSNLEKLEAQYGADRKKVEIQEQKILLEKEKSEKKTLSNLTLFLVGVMLIFFIFLFVIRKKNKRLNKLLAENEFLIGETNHRIKNNLQIIVSLVSREMYKHENEEVDSLKNIASKIESIATLHQQMYINEEKSEIDLTNYLRTLGENLSPLCEVKNIKLDVDIEEGVVFGVSKSIYIGLLFNELIVNSLKHAFEDSSENATVRVMIKKMKGFAEINFSDNGKGLPQGKKPKLIDMMCRQLKCTYEIKNENGFQFKMNLKND